MRKAEQATSSRRRQLGLTLVEAAAVLGIGAAVIVGALAIYSNANSAQLAAEALNQLNVIQQSVRQLYGTQKFLGLDTKILVESKALPQKMIAGAEALRNPYGGTWVVESAPLGAGFVVTLNNLPSPACVALSSKDLGRSVVTMEVNDKVFDYTVAERLPLPADLGPECDKAKPATVVWNFKN